MYVFDTVQLSSGHQIKLKQLIDAAEEVSHSRESSREKEKMKHINDERLSACIQLGM